MSKIDPRWLSSTVLSLAREIKGRGDARLPILADALMDAGCDNKKLIANLQANWLDRDEAAAEKLIEQIREVDFANRISGRLLRCTWPVYDLHGAYGSGGWSRTAKHRPLPRWETIETTDVQVKGKSIVVNGVRRLKLNIVDVETGEVLRSDYLETK